MQLNIARGCCQLSMKEQPDDVRRFQTDAREPQRYLRIEGKIYWEKEILAKYNLKSKNLCIWFSLTSMTHFDRINGIIYAHAKEINRMHLYYTVITLSKWCDDWVLRLERVKRIVYMNECESYAKKLDQSSDPKIFDCSVLPNQPDASFDNKQRFILIPLNRCDYFNSLLKWSA